MADILSAEQVEQFAREKLGLQVLDLVSTRRVIRTRFGWVDVKDLQQDPRFLWPAETWLKVKKFRIEWHGDDVEGPVWLWFNPKRPGWTADCSHEDAVLHAVKAVLEGK